MRSTRRHPGTRTTGTRCSLPGTSRSRPPSQGPEECARTETGVGRGGGPDDQFCEGILAVPTPSVRMGNPTTSVVWRMSLLAGSAGDGTRQFTLPAATGRRGRNCLLAAVCPVSLATNGKHVPRAGGPEAERMSRSDALEPIGIVDDDAIGIDRQLNRLIANSYRYSPPSLGWGSWQV